MRALAGERDAWWPELEGDTGHAIETPDGPAWLEPVPGHAGAWLQLGPDASEASARPAKAGAAAAVVGRVWDVERQLGVLAAEVATGYQEVDLLYTISDILGRTVRLEEAAQRIVREVSDVVGARRASLMVYDETARQLRVVAQRGVEDPEQRAPVSVDDERSIAARVFRERAMLSRDRSERLPPPLSAVGRHYRGESFLSVPILYGPPGGEPRPVGVINLTDRLGEDAFTDQNKKLVTAIANQIGAAIENARLVEREKRRARMSTELELAHELQLALLPPEPLLAKAGDVGARCQSAESVGGDFYDLIPLASGALGVMIGDVSTHGLSAALMMAHSISAAAILAQSAKKPEQALERLLEVVGAELARAELFMSLFYGVVDTRRAVLRYASAGHPYAFIVPGPRGRPRRLEATAPPLGLGQGPRVAGADVPWRSGRDLLCLFTDGLPDALSGAGERYGEERLLAVVCRHQREAAARIVDAVFTDLEAFAAAGAVADDRTLVILRR